MKLISVGVDEDILEHISSIVEEEGLRVKNAEGAFINVLLRKALGCESGPDSGFALDPLIDDVVGAMEDLVEYPEL